MAISGITNAGTKEVKVVSITLPTLVIALIAAFVFGAVTMMRGGDKPAFAGTNPATSVVPTTAVPAPK